MSNLQGNPGDNFEQEISLRDVIDFIVDSWKSLAFFTLVGIACASVYLWMAPKEYQATAQIQMAQYAVNAGNLSSIISPVGVNVEEPGRLVLRLQNPAGYSDEIVDLCGLKNSKDPKEKLAKLVKVTIPKGANSIVELNANFESKETSLACMNGLFVEISRTQVDIAEPFFDEIKKSLAENSQQIDRAKANFAKAAGGPSLLATSSFLLARDEINRLAENSVVLEYVLEFRETRKTKLLSPIYVSPAPVSSGKNIVVLLGLMGGLLIGVFIQFLKRIHMTQR